MNELEAFAKKEKLIKRLNELLGHTGIVGEDRNRIFLLIIAISHKMPETLHALIQGSQWQRKDKVAKAGQRLHAKGKCNQAHQAKR